MPADAPAKPPVTFIDDPRAQEFFIDGCTGFSIYNNVVRLTFESLRVDHTTSPGPTNRVVNVRLAMPTVAAQTLAAGLYDFLKKHGLDPVPQPPKEAMQ